LAPTHQLVIDSDQLQQRLGEGPCFDAARSSQGERVFRIADLTGEQPRWPAYAPQVRALGVGSMMGFLLFTDDENLGALNLYSRKPGAFTEASELAGWLLASHAAVAFSSARTQMEHALATRHTIGEAMGILMGSRHLTEH
ncbi:GAF domain-containing protein, partial [Streptomyces mirabilis]